jgi:hypothetical protein
MDLLNKNIAFKTLRPTLSFPSRATETSWTIPDLRGVKTKAVTGRSWSIILVTS